MQDTFARATHSAGRPSAARDDRVSCIQQQFLNGVDYIKLSNFPLIKLHLAISNNNLHNFDDINYGYSDDLKYKLLTHNCLET